MGGTGQANEAGGQADEAGGQADEAGGQADRECAVSSLIMSYRPFGGRVSESRLTPRCAPVRTAARSRETMGAHIDTPATAAGASIRP
jgi:hypothetical protein